VSAGPFQQRAAFKQFAKGAGKISFNDFRDTLKDNFSMDITDDECTAMFAVYDTNLNGSLEYKEFCRLVIKPDFCSVQTW